MPAEKTPKTTGTLPEDDRDAPEDTETTGTLEAEGRDAEGDDEPDYKALYLGSKDKIEQANALKAQVDELSAALEERRAGPQPAAGATIERMRGDIDEAEADIAELRRVQSVDPAARQLLRQELAMQSLRRDTMDAFALQTIPPAKRAAVLKLYEHNRDRFGDLAAAADAYNGRALQAELTAAQAELATLKNGTAKAKPKAEREDEGEEERSTAVRTGGRDLPSGNPKDVEFITRAKWKAEQERLYAEDNPREARRRQGLLREKKIVFRN